MNGFYSSWGSKFVGVLGGGRSGVAASKFLVELGAKVLVSDKGRLSFRLKEDFKTLGITWEEGGHSRIRTCDIVIVSPGVSIHSPIVRRIQEQKIPLLGELELGARFLKGTLAAITGTNGKSTVVSWVTHIFKNKGALSCGNIGLPITEFAGKHLYAGKIFVVEVSSFQLATTFSFRPQVACILNIDQDHLDWHASYEEYCNTKKKVFAQQERGDILILNFDDPNTRVLKGKSQVWFFSLNSQVKGSHLFKDELILQLEKEKIPLLKVNTLQVQGPHNIANALAAALVAYFLGARPEEIREGLSTFRGLPHRVEYIGEVAGVKFFNDSKGTNPHAVLWALKTFTVPVILIMGGDDKGVDFKPLGPLLVQKVKTLIVLGAASQRLQKTFQEVITTLKAENIEEATQAAFKLARPGEVVLLSPGCASFDMFKDYRERGEVFRYAVQELAQ